MAVSKNYFEYLKSDLSELKENLFRDDTITASKRNELLSTCFNFLLSRVNFKTNNLISFFYFGLLVLFLVLT